MKLDDATEVWSQLDTIADRFDADWRARETPPPLGEYLPAEPANLRRVTLLELIKIDLEYRWKQLGRPKRIEEYAAEFAELREPGGVPADLVFEEFQVRRRVGEDPKPAEYLERFPQHEEAIRKLLNVKDPQATTKFFNAGKPRKAQAGERIEDFELLVPLGEGAFAQVFLARQISMQRLLAVKLSSDRGDEPQTLAQLDHPNIVRVYDQRLLPERQQRILYMQHVPGGTLLDVLRRAAVHPPATRRGQVLLDAVRSALERAGQPAPPGGPAQQRLAAASWSEVVCRIGAQLALALDYAHEKGVLHRDVKPANVLLTADATPQLADFNISFSAAVEGATPAAYFGGSLAYMSPEQLEAANPLDERQPGELDGRSDLYSLAVLLWELATTERPFHDEELADGWVATLQSMTERRKARAYGRPKAPPGDTVFGPLIEVLEKCLEPDPNQRPSDGRRLARELLLCTNPRARKLLSPDGRLRRRMRQHAVIACLALAFVPNAIAAWSNLKLNELTQEALIEASAVFPYLVIAVNGIAFPVCMVILARYVWPVGQMLKCKPRSAEEEELERRLDRALDDVDADHSASKRFPARHPEPTPELRARALAMGHAAAMISIAGWAAAAPVYPLAMGLVDENFPPAAYVHFFLSLTLSGLIAAAYPFFIISRVALRTWYPALLALSTGGSDDEVALARLTRRAGAYLLVAGGVPLIGLALLVLGGEQPRLVLGIMCGVGIVGLALAFWQYRETQRDVAALLSAALPEESGQVGGESVDSFMG